MDNKIQEAYHKIAVTKEAILLKSSNDHPCIWDSKIGGSPYLLEDDEYPSSPDTFEPFDFLLQINCSELVENEYLPKSGLLQFFLNRNYTFGSEDKPFEIRYLAHIVQDENKIAYELDEDETFDIDEDDCEEDEDEDEIDKQEFKITFEKAVDHINSTTMEWNDFKKELAIELFNDRDDIEDYESLLEEDVYFNGLNHILEDEQVVRVLQATKLFGYPDNEENDPRLNDDKYKDYILLLQIHPDSEFFEKEEESIEWFINPEDLKNLNFDNVLCSYYSEK